MSHAQLMRLASAIVALTLAVSTSAQPPEPRQAITYLSDGFDLPVGKPDAEGYYKARGYRPNGHLGEDWNGKGGGDTDLGDPVYAVSHGAVVYAQDFGHGWGNVVIIRHAYEEDGKTKFVDSLYGHLDQIQTRYGVHVKRGQQIGTIGTGNGRYDAHLHFEIRKDLRVGMARHRFPRNDQTYFNPTTFITAHRQLARSGSTTMIPIHTFVPYETVVTTEDTTEEPALVLPSGSKSVPKKNWKPNRYDDLKK